MKSAERSAEVEWDFPAWKAFSEGRRPEMNTKAAVLLLCLSCLQLGCDSSSSSGNSESSNPGTSASESQAKKTSDKLDRMAEKLSRSTAMSILKERFPVPPDNRIADASFPSTVTARLGGTKPEDDYDLPFYRRLVAEGFLKDAGCKPGTDEYPFWSCSFVLVPHSDFRIGNNGVIFVTLARSRWNAVTGVMQQGSTARVEVEVVTGPTDTWKRLAPIVESESKNHPAPFVLRSDMRWRSIPADLREMRVGETFYFARYDDGWRLESVR